MQNGSVLTSYEELQHEMDLMYFARCVWQEEDLDALDEIGKLPDELRGQFVLSIASTLEDIMTSTGWDVLNQGLCNFLRDHDIAVDDDVDQEDLELLSMHTEKNV